MPVYEYTALNKAGKKINGIISADSSKSARQKLRSSGFFPVKIQESTRKHKDSNSESLSTFFKRVKSAELSIATRQLSILLGAGITLVPALGTLVSQTTNPLLKKRLAQIKESVNEGNSFAFSLAQYPKLFSRVYINMVRAGEASGSLELVLERLADFSENQQALKTKFQAALVYPVFMFFVSIIVIFILITYVVPSITKVFSDMHQALPLPTVMLISLSSFFKSYWWLVLTVTGIAGLAIRQFMQSSRGRWIWDGLKLSLPVLSTININIAMARFGRTLGSLLQSGVAVLPSLEIVKNVLNNSVISKSIDDAMEQVEAGKSLAMPFSRNKKFPSIAVQMISVGEQSGELEKMLHKIADIYEREAESQIMALTSLLEPVMILAMGVTVAFIVISILLPLSEMNQLIR